jgi:hypothetical protein
MNGTDPRRLLGLRFGLSISAAPDMAVGGDPEQAVNGLTFRLASAILLEGGSLLLGHRWRPDGIMEHLAFQARDSRWSGSGKTTGGTAQQTAPVLNLIAWPDAPPQGDRNAQKLIQDGVLDVRQVLPPDIPLDRLDADPQKALATDLGKLARIRALTAMRQEMVRHADARICLGGASGNPHRRLPGVIEEALLTCQAGKPLYIASALGGAAKAMADAILQRRISDEARALFFTPPAVVGLFAQASQEYPVPLEEGPSTESGWSALKVFEAIPMATLSRRSGLTEDEYLQLLTTGDVQRALSLAITGVVRLRRNPGPSAQTMNATP